MTLIGNGWATYEGKVNVYNLVMIRKILKWKNAWQRRIITNEWRKI